MLAEPLIGTLGRDGARLAAGEHNEVIGVA
jgi:hypothetical protein